MIRRPIITEVFFLVDGSDIQNIAPLNDCIQQLMSQMREWFSNLWFNLRFEIYDFSKYEKWQVIENDDVFRPLVAGGSPSIKVGIWQLITKLRNMYNTDKERIQEPIFIFISDGHTLEDCSHVISDLLNEKNYQIATKYAIHYKSDADFKNLSLIVNSREAIVDIKSINLLFQFLCSYPSSTYFFDGPLDEEDCI